MPVVKRCPPVKGCFYHKETQPKQKTDKSPNRARNTPAGSPGKQFPWSRVLGMGSQRCSLKRAAVRAAAASGPCPSHPDTTRTLPLRHLLPAGLRARSPTGLLPAHGMTTSCSFHRYHAAPCAGERGGGLGTHMGEVGHLGNREYRAGDRNIGVSCL